MKNKKINFNYLFEKEKIINILINNINILKNR